MSSSDVCHVPLVWFLPLAVIQTEIVQTLKDTRRVIKTKHKLEVVVVTSALDYMQAESRLAVIGCSLPRRYGHLSNINMAAALMLYHII